MDNFEYGTTRVVDEGSSSLTPSDTIVEFNASMEPQRTKLYKGRRMEKVPLAMREDEKAKKYFDPKVVSIGPYHHGKEELQTGERLKSNVAKLYIVSSGRSMDEFRFKISETVDVFRSYYLEGSTDKYSDKDFVEMMVIEGLFVLAYMEVCMQSPGGENIEKEALRHLGSHATFLLGVDVLHLLENQLPFQVLELLLNLKSEHINFTKFLVEFINALQYIRCGISEHQQEKKEPNRESRERIHTKQLLHFPECFWRLFNRFSQASLVSNTFNKGCILDQCYSFRSISGLKAKGIHARRLNSNNIMDIKFRPFLFFFAVLEIPPVVLTPHFIISLTNLIAYEGTPNNPNSQQCTMMTYVNLLKSLINKVEDAEELRERNILFCPGSSDEEVVKMISSIPTIFLEDVGIYATVKQGIKEHCENKAKTWIAELNHNYFNSPWAFIAFLAATALITMTFLQTYFTIHPRTPPV